MTSYLILFLLFLLQFVYLPFGTSFFEGSKVYVAELIIFLLLLFRLFSKRGMAFQTYRKSFLICFVALIIVTAYHLIANSTQTVFFGNPFRLQGTLLLWFLLAFAFLSTGINIEKKRFPFLVLSTIILQVICTVLFIGVGSDRPIGTIGEPNALAAGVLFLWPFLFFTSFKSKWRFGMGALGILLVFIILFISGSRSGMIAFVVQLFFLMLLRVFPKRFALNTILALVLIAASYIIPILSQGDLYENRGEIWKSAIVAGSTHPIVGVGFGNAEYELHKANIKLHNHLPGYYVDSSHNIFLDWWVQGGLVGLGILCFLLFQTFRSFIKEKNIRNSVLLLGLLAALSFNPASIVSLIALWWLIGQGV